MKDLLNDILENFLSAMHLWLLAVCCFLTAAKVSAGEAPRVTALQTPRITGTIYQEGSDRKKVLFTFERTATNDGPFLRVERKFIGPDGFVAAVEEILYETNQLVAYDLKDYQAGVWGDIEVSSNSKKPAQSEIFINYRHAPDAKKNAGQNLQPDTLIDDTIYPFVIAHWDALMKGETVKFRFVSLESERTFAFRLEKESETTWHDIPMVRIKMEPTSIFVSHFVDPIYLTIEKGGAHRIAEYIGRTTPRIQKGKSWKYLDAETVFDWK